MRGILSLPPWPDVPQELNGLKKDCKVCVGKGYEYSIHTYSRYLDDDLSM